MSHQVQVRSLKMKLFTIIFLVGQILASQRPFTTSTEYSPEKDPAVSHLLLKVPGKADRVAIYAIIYNERKRQGKRITRAFIKEFERIKAQRAAELAANPDQSKPGQAQSSSQVVPTRQGNQRRNRQPGQQQSGATARYNNPYVSSPSSARPQNTADTSSNSSSYPTSYNAQGMPPRSGQPSQPGSAMSRPGTPSWDHESEYVLSNFNERLIQRIYRFERERRTRNRGGSGIPGAPRPTPVPGHAVRGPEHVRPVAIQGSPASSQSALFNAHAAPRTGVPPPPATPPPKKKKNSIIPLMLRRSNKSRPTSNVVPPQASPAPSPVQQASPPPKARRTFFRSKKAPNPAPVSASPPPSPAKPVPQPAKAKKSSQKSKAVANPQENQVVNQSPPIENQPFDNDESYEDGQQE